MANAHFVAALILTCLLGTQAQARPYIPKDGAQVIERLPGRLDPEQRELQQLRAQLTVAPDNLELATQLARRYIDIGRKHGDPRYLGYAQAALAHWWEQAAPPLEVRVLRATLLQSQHRFAAALADLDGIIKSDSRNAQAWLTRATVLQVQGRSAEARSSCTRLYGMATELVMAACIAHVGSLTGQADKSYALLEQALDRDRHAESAVNVWARTLLAEIAARKDRATAAEQHFRQALALAPSDSYLLGAYADFLLDRQRSAEVLTLLKNQTRSDGLLLRYVEALRQQRSTQADEQIRLLQARFAAATMRGDSVHQREQARFELRLMNKPEAALRIAQENWRIQKEPADARIVLEAAAAANDKESVAAVAAWIKASGLEDASLIALARRAGGLA